MTDTTSSTFQTSAKLAGYLAGAGAFLSAAPASAISLPLGPVNDTDLDNAGGRGMVVVDFSDLDNITGSTGIYDGSTLISDSQLALVSPDFSKLFTSGDVQLAEAQAKAGINVNVAAEDLMAGDTIDETLTWKVLDEDLSYGTGEYVGLRVRDSLGVWNYGYMEYDAVDPSTVSDPSNATVTLTGLAINRNTNQGLTIPEPGSLALLVAGAAGVSAFRRRRGKAAEAA